MALSLTKKKPKTALEVAQDRHDNALGWLYAAQDELILSTGLYDDAAEELSAGYDAHHALAGEHLAGILESQQGKTNAQLAVQHLGHLLDGATDEDVTVV